MPFFNAAPFIGAAIQSILDQEFTDYELLILDDASEDESLHIARSFQDPRIHIFQHTENRGVVSSRNDLLSRVKGRYLAFFDADDLAFPKKFSRQIAYLEAHPDISLLGSSVTLIDENGTPTGRWRLGCGPEELRARMLFHNYLVNSAVVVRADAIRPYKYEAGSDICEDYLMWWRILQKHQGANLPDDLCAYRVHFNSLTGGNREKLYRCEQRVHRQILAEMGLQPTPTQLNIHHHLRQASLPANSKTLRATVEWIAELVLAGQKSGWIGGPAARHIAVNRWAKAMKQCRRKPGVFLYGLLLLPKLIRSLILQSAGK